MHQRGPSRSVREVRQRRSYDIDIDFDMGRTEEEFNELHMDEFLH